VAPASPHLAQLLELPVKLFAFDGTELSLSSDPSISIAEVTAALTSLTPMPSCIPDYGLHVARRGSHVFCTVVDRRRRIIVMHSLTGVLGEHRSWDSFMYAIEEATAIATTMLAQGEDFEFVVNKESAIRIVRS
jgi:hypothetical protein